VIVKLKSAVSCIDGSWGPGLRDLPDKLAAELVAGGLAEKVEPAQPVAAKPTPKKARRKG